MPKDKEMRLFPLDDNRHIVAEEDFVALIEKRTRARVLAEVREKLHTQLVYHASEWGVECIRIMDLFMRGAPLDPGDGPLSAGEGEK